MNDIEVTLVPLTDIIYKQRAFNEEEREQLGLIRDSIKGEGLLHPITVERLPNAQYELKAGLKRLLACEQIGMNMIMCLILSSDMDEQKKKEIHIHENLFRFNVPWYDQVILKKELLDLRQAQKGMPKQGKKVGFSLRDLAMELNGGETRGLGTLSEDIRLAEAVLSNPNLKKIKDKITAKRLIFQESKRVEAESEAGLAPSIDFNQVYLGESSELLKHFPDNTFDGCVTDPPWLDFRIENLRKDDKTLLVFKELYRVLKQGSFLYAFVSTPDFIIYQQELPKFGFNVAQMPLVWVKVNHMSHGLRGWEYSRDYEPILYAVKGSPVLTTSGQLSSIFTYPLVHPTKAIHPNEKPVALIEHLLSHCSYDGSFMIEPFGGSGVLAEACLRQNRRYVLLEREKEYYDNINKRLDKVRSELQGEAKSEVQS